MPGLASARRATLRAGPDPVALTHSRRRARRPLRCCAQLPGIVTSPTSADEHSKNFGIVLKAIAEHGDVIDVVALGVEDISAQALAEGDLQALNDFAGIFAALCNALLQHGGDDRPATGSSSSMPPARADVRPASAIPASKCADGGLATGAEPEPPAEYAEDVEAGGAAQATGAGAGAAVHAACADALATAVAEDAAGTARAPRPTSGARPKAPSAARKPCAPKVQGKSATACMKLHAISQATAQRGTGSASARPRTAPAKGAGGGRSGAATARAGGASSTHLEAEIAALQAKILERKDDGAETERLGKALGDEYGARASSVYAALIKQSLAGVRRAEALEIARGVASTRNAQRDARIAAIREQRAGGDVLRAERARDARRAAKEELKYRNLYQQAIALERERLLLEESTGEEARRKTLAAQRKRAAARESFHMQQLELLSQQLATERQERAFRERVQRAMGAKLEAEARQKQAAALRLLKETLAHEEALEESVAPVPIF